MCVSQKVIKEHSTRILCVGFMAHPCWRRHIRTSRLETPTPRRLIRTARRIIPTCAFCKRTGVPFSSTRFVAGFFGIPRPKPSCRVDLIGPDFKFFDRCRSGGRLSLHPTRHPTKKRIMAINLIPQPGPLSTPAGARVHYAAINRSPSCYLPTMPVLRPDSHESQPTQHGLQLTQPGLQLTQPGSQTSAAWRPDT